jgi:folate-binding protein YgfZ
MIGFNPLERVEAICEVDPADRIQLLGRDAADLLHRICASETRDLPETGCRHLVFTDDKGAVVAAPLVAPVPGGFRLVAGPGRGAELGRWIEKWIIVEDARIEPDPRPAWRLGEPDLASGGEVMAASPGLAGAAIQVTETPPAPLVTAEAWEVLMFRAGRLHCGPATAAGPNPLELGWKPLISFDKGCYIGQEVIARLDTYDKVRRGLACARLEAPLTAGAGLRHDGRRRGIVLSSLLLDEGCFAWVVVDRDLEPGSGLQSDTETAGTLLGWPATSAESG